MRLEVDADECPAWLSPVFYIWVGIIAVLAPTQVWTLANFLPATREAKRIFAMVGSGGICGWIFTGYFSMLWSFWRTSEIARAKCW